MKKMIEQMEDDTTYDSYGHQQENDIFAIKKLTRSEQLNEELKR